MERFTLLARMNRGLHSGVLISVLVLAAGGTMFAQNPVSAAADPSAVAAQSEKKVGDTPGADADKQTDVTTRIAQPESAGLTESPSAVPPGGQDSAVAAAKDAAQNPVANTISIPLQNNSFFNFGGYKRRVNALEIEPVIPFRLSENWILITRTIIPLVYMPRVSPSQSDTFGLGNINPQFYLSPAHPGKIIWGAGPQLWVPTATDDRIGVNKWGAGPAVVMLTKRGHWLFGTLANNIWTGGAGHRGHQDTAEPTVFHSINQMTLNPFVYYNMKGGWYFVSSEIMTADWAARSANRWTVPVGGGAGRVFKIGTQMLNARVQAWKDVMQPVGGQSWTLQTQVQLLFPRKPSHE